MPPVVPRSNRIVRRTAMIGAATAAFLLLTADYGPDYPNPIRKAMESLFSKPDRSVGQAQQTNSKPDGS